MYTAGTEPSGGAETPALTFATEAEAALEVAELVNPEAEGVAFAYRNRVMIAWAVVAVILIIAYFVRSRFNQTHSTLVKWFEAFAALGVAGALVVALRS